MKLTDKIELNKIYHKNWLDNNLPDKCAQLIIADPPYYKVKGEFDFIWKTFEDYLINVEKWAKECKRVLSDNGTLFWYSSAKKIAYSQIIFDKYFNLLNNITWENTNNHKQQIRFSEDLRTFAPLGERILMYEKSGQKTGGELIFEQFLKPQNPFSKYLRDEFLKAKVNNIEIAKLFPSKSGGLTGCVSNWLNGDNIITEEQYNTIRQHLNNEYLKKEYEDLRQEYEDLRQEYEDLRQEYEDLRQEYEDLKKEYESKRRVFNNFMHLGDVIKFPNYETSDHDHETIKPEKLTRVLILTCSKPNDLIVVPFSGSGTECAMSAKEERKFVGYDIEKKYVDISNKRIKPYLQQKRMF